MRKNYFLMIIISFIIFFLFKYNTLIEQAVLKSCHLFLNKVFPSLFPMLIFSDLLIFLGLPDLLCHLFGNIYQKIFHTSPYGAFAFFMSLFSGTPANAYILKNLVNENKLSHKEASYIFSFSFFTNPLFYYSMLSFIFPGNHPTILKLLIIPYLANLIVAFLLRPPISNNQVLIYENNNNSLINVLINSIKKGMDTMLLILGSIVFFFIINALANPINNPFISGIFEISQGLNSLGMANLSSPIKEVFTLIFVSFGGLSIHLQIKSILNDTKIDLAMFFKARLIEAIICLILWGIL